MKLLYLHLDLYEEQMNLHGLPYEPLKHYYKIYINNFPGASDLRAKLMETRSIAEAREVLKTI